MLELIYGGAASGKSEFAEREALRLSGPHVYLATMRHGSRSGEDRIKKHVERRRGTDFITIECPQDISSVADKVKGATVLLECLTNLAANEMFLETVMEKGQSSGDGGDGASALMSDNLDIWNVKTKTIYDKLMGDIYEINAVAANLVVVSGDLMRDGVRYDAGTEEYIKLISSLNTRVASISERTYEIVYSCAKRLK